MQDWYFDKATITDYIGQTGVFFILEPFVCVDTQFHINNASRHFHVYTYM